MGDSKPPTKVRWTKVDTEPDQDMTPRPYKECNRDRKKKPRNGCTVFGGTKRKAYNDEGR